MSKGNFVSAMAYFSTHSYATAPPPYLDFELRTLPNRSALTVSALHLGFPTVMPADDLQWDQM